jgi:hypothetical protein
MRLSPLTSLAATIALTAGLLSPAHAVLVGGKKNNCSAVWDTGPAGPPSVIASTTGKPSTFSCADGDPTCDADGLPNGTCIINLNVCVGEATDTCTTPGSLTALTFNAPISKKNILGSAFHAPPVSPAGCGLAGTMSLSLKRVPKNTSKPLKKFNSSKPVVLVMKDKGFVNKLRVQCVPPQGTAVCPSRGGLPSQITLTVPATGSDLDNGWTGLSHNFPIVNGSQLRYCLNGCDGTSTFDCTGTGATGANSLNGATFGAPLPLLAAGTPVCVVNRYMPNETLQGSFNLQTGVFGTTTPNGNLVSLFSDVYLRTTFPEVCPRCTIPGGGGDIGSVGKCSATSKTPGADCRVDGKVVVAGQGLYLLSSACVPLGDSTPTSLDIELPLTTGTAKEIVGSKPCPDSAGPQTQDDNCNGAACNAQCTGTACASQVGGNCIDAKGGISQFCCSNNTSLPCFPTSPASAAAGLGKITRTGTPVIPGGAQGTFAGTFCIAHTDSSLINAVTGLPGPGALLLPATAVVSTQ